MSHQRHEEVGILFWVAGKVLGTGSFQEREAWQQVASILALNWEVKTPCPLRLSFHCHDPNGTCSSLCTSKASIRKCVHNKSSSELLINYKLPIFIFNHNILTTQNCFFFKGARESGGRNRYNI